jgi:hypothetical protein
LLFDCESIFAKEITCSILFQIGSKVKALGKAKCVMVWCFFFSGEGISQNKSLAAYYYKLSADQGQVHAQARYAEYL